MSVTVLWEDQRSLSTKAFGPHALLLSCVADDLSSDVSDQMYQRSMLTGYVIGYPKKGNGSVLAALKTQQTFLRGPVVAVIDRDKAHKLWKDAATPPASCMQGLSAQFRASAPGSYDLIFMVNNTEDLLAATCEALSRSVLTYKPDPDERDRILGAASWGAREIRSSIRRKCPSFDRIVARVGSHYSKL